MCTVTFCPTQNGYLLFQSRDESYQRKLALQPKLTTITNKKVLMPIDQEAGGSWFGVDQQGNGLCLFNGAFEKHKRNLPYRKSRGIVFTDFWQYEDIFSFVQKYDFTQIEPFSMIHIAQNALKVYELKWDGKNTYLFNLPSNAAFIRSSCTLYTYEMHAKRRAWFKHFLLQNSEPTLEQIDDFYHTAGEGDKNIDLLIDRPPKVHTVNLTGLKVEKGMSKMIFYDLVHNIFSQTQV